MGWKEEQFPQKNRIYRKNQVDIIEFKNIVSKLKTHWIGLIDWI